METAKECENKNLKEHVKETRTGREEKKTSRKQEYKGRSANGCVRAQWRCVRMTAGLIE